MGIPIPVGVDAFDPATQKSPVEDGSQARAIIEREFDPTVHKIPVEDDDDALAILDREFDPEIHKEPVSKEYMALALGGNVQVEDDDLLDCFKDALYESIAGMIYSIARKYERTCRDDRDDLANECIAQIWLKMPKFNPKLALFNTWAWRVATNKLNRNYQKSRRHQDNYTEWTEMCDNYGESDVPKEISDDIYAVLGQLFEQFPDKADILSEMFFRGDKSVYIPEKISLRGVARAVDRDYAEVYSFIRNKVRPFIKRKFGVSHEQHWT